MQCLSSTIGKFGRMERVLFSYPRRISLLSPEIIFGMRGKTAKKPSASAYCPSLQEVCQHSTYYSNIQTYFCCDEMIFANPILPPRKTREIFRARKTWSLSLSVQENVVIVGSRKWRDTGQQSSFFITINCECKKPEYWTGHINVVRWKGGYFSAKTSVTILKRDADDVL